jgi:xanthine/CO dehydrogenase XdhC/CoxF family maturation factor
LARAARAALDAGRPAVLATLVASEGPAYLPPGARLLVDAEGPRAGLLSGGCLEDEVAARVRDVRPGDPARLLSLETAGDEIDGLGLGCGGRLTVLAEPLADTAGWRAWLTALSACRPAARRLRREGSVGWRSEAGAFGPAPPPRPLAPGPADVRPRLRPARDGWLERTPAPPRVTVVGHGPEAEALLARAARLGWRLRAVGPSRRALARLRAALPAEAELEVVLADAAGLRDGPVDRPGLELGPDDRILAAARRLDLDAAAAAWGLRGGAARVAVVAGRARAETLRARPELRGLPGERLEAPAGLPIGARGPEEIASAVAASWLADLRARTAPVWAVVPAAGAGRRLGGGKPGLRKDGESLVGRVQRRAEAACDGTVVVLGHEADAVRREVDAGAHAVVAERWRDGLAASLRAGLRAVPEGARALVVLPDMPGVTAEHLAALRAAAASSAGAVSRYPDGRRGAPALLPADLVAAERATAVPPAGDTGFAARLAARADLAEVPLRDATDLDTLDAARAAGWTPDGADPAAAGQAAPASDDPPTAPKRP